MKTRIVSAGWLYELANELIDDAGYYDAVAQILYSLDVELPEGPDDETTPLRGRPLSFYTFNQLKNRLDENYAKKLTKVDEEPLPSDRGEQYILLSDALIKEFGYHARGFPEPLGEAIRYAALTAPWIAPTKEQEEQWKKVCNKFHNSERTFIYRLSKWNKG